MACRTNEQQHPTGKRKAVLPPQLHATGTGIQLHTLMYVLHVFAGLGKCPVNMRIYDIGKARKSQKRDFPIMSWGPDQVTSGGPPGPFARRGIHGMFGTAAPRLPYL